MKTMKEPDMDRYYERLDLMAERQREEAALAEIRAEEEEEKKKEGSK